MESNITILEKENEVRFSTLQEIEELIEHEKVIFNGEEKDNSIVHYSISNDNKYSFPYLKYFRYNTLFSIFNNTNYSLFRNLASSNDTFYRKKWIYQIINSIFEVHKRESQPYIGTLSNECITINNQLDAYLGFLSKFPKGSTMFNNCFYFYEPTRFKKQIIMEENVDNINREDEYKWEGKEIEDKDYQKYDVFALGVLLSNILNCDIPWKKFSTKKAQEDFVKSPSRYGEINANNNENNANNDRDTTTTNNENNDNNTNNNEENNNDIDPNKNIKDDFVEKTNNIINLCTQEINRPNISEIKKEFEQQFGEIKSSNIDVRSLNRQGSDIFQVLSSNKTLIELFSMESESTKPNFFKLNSSFAFSVNYYPDYDTFMTIPIPLDLTEQDTERVEEYNEELNSKFKLDFFQNNFFSNLFFCNLFDLLKCYTPTEDEIIYWIIYISDFINEMHKVGHYLPLNFTMENILVSFFGTSNEKGEAAKNFQLQLSIFPLNTPSKLNSDKYVCEQFLSQENSGDRSDTYSFGVLAFELLYKFSKGNYYFEDLNNKNNRMPNYLADRKEYAKYNNRYPFLISLIESCLFNTKEDDQNPNSPNLTFEFIHGRLGAKYKKLNEPGQTENKFKSYLENINLEKPSTMSAERFCSLFLYYKEIYDKNLFLIFNNTISNLFEENIEDYLTFNPQIILNYLQQKENQNNGGEEEEEENQKNGSEEEEIQEENIKDEPPEVIFHNFDMTPFSTHHFIESMNEHANVVMKENIVKQKFINLDKRNALLALQTIYSYLSPYNFCILEITIINDNGEDDLVTIDDIKGFAKARDIETITNDNNKRNGENHDENEEEQEEEEEGEKIILLFDMKIQKNIYTDDEDVSSGDDF